VAQCGVARVYKALSDEDKKALRALLSAPISATSVAREIEAAGHKMSYQIVYRHKRKICSCDTL